MVFKREKIITVKEESPHTFKLICGLDEEKALMVDDKNEEFEYILNQIEYGIVVLNKNDLKIVKLNEAAKKMFALPEIDENFNIVAYIQKKFRVNVSDNGYFYFEGETVDNCNSIFEVYTKFIGNEAAGETGKIVAIIRDVTAVKAQELKKLNLLGIISHKLKTHITEARASLRLLKEQGMAEESGEQQRQALKAVNEHCEKLDELIEKLLLFPES
ncbi:MAG: histidine kinase dimerization/phospho-acceptor domain-containing protein [Candidatus Omnitrophota bacterium]